MARAQGDPHAICCIEQARQKMSPEEFEREFPNVGPCANVQLGSKKFQQAQSKRRIYNQPQESTASDIDGKIVHTRSGSSTIYCCKNHDNYVSRVGSAIERYLQYIRPELNDGESSKVLKRFKEREDRDANKEASQESRMTRDKQRRKNKKPNLNRINIFSPGEPSDQDFSTEPIVDNGTAVDNGTTYLKHEAEAPPMSAKPVDSVWNNIVVNDDDDDEKPISTDSFVQQPEETPMPTSEETPMSKPEPSPTQINRSRWDDLEITDEEE